MVSPRVATVLRDHPTPRDPINLPPHRSPQAAARRGHRSRNRHRRPLLPLPPAIPPIRRPSRRRGVRGLLGFESNRIPELLELLVAQLDGRRIERDPDSPGFADRYAVRPADTHAVGQGGRPLPAGDAGFRVVRPNTVVQRFPGILPDRCDSALGGLPIQVACAWRTGGRRTGIVRSPYLPGQQNLMGVNVAMEGHQPDIDSPVRQLGHHSVGVRIGPETDQDHPDGPEGLSPLASVPLLEVPYARDAVVAGSLGRKGSSMAARSTKPVSAGICRPTGVRPVISSDRLPRCRCQSSWGDGDSPRDVGAAC